jgi:hypothetical protein
MSGLSISDSSRNTTGSSTAAITSAPAPVDWLRFTAWKKRARDLQVQLKDWEQSHSEIAAVKAALQSAQKELSVRVEELRAAKAANQDLLSMTTTSSSMTSMAKLVGIGSTAATDADDKKNEIFSSPPSADVEKLQAEIKVNVTDFFDELQCTVYIIWH